ncbi:MAG: hypothetical protein ACREHG_08070 [Candidatus Saccharimonadales bacterium]
MPLDPSIILKTVNAGDVAAKNMQEDQAAQATANQLALQKYTVAQAKQNFDDQQNLKQAWRAANGDPSKTVAIAAQLGVSPGTIEKFQAAQLAMRTNLANLNKTELGNKQTQLSMLNDKNEHLYNLLESATNADPANYLKKLSTALSLAQAQGYSSGDQAKAISGMTQDDLKDYTTGLLNIKAHTDVINAEAAATSSSARKEASDAETSKQTNTSASQIAKANQDKLTGASTKLANALRLGGTVGYNKVMEQYASDPLVASAFPTAAQVAQMTPKQAFKAINEVAMTPQARQQQANSDRTFAEEVQKANQAEAHNQATERFATINNQRAAQKYAEEFGGNVIEGWVKQIKTNPDAVSNLPAPIKSQVAMQFQKDTGMPLPTALTGKERVNMSNYRFTQNIVGDLEDMVKDPEVQAVLGPVSGRIANGESVVGTGLTQKQQQFVTKIEYLFAGEGRAIFGGRPPEKLLSALKAVSANARKNLPQLQGALAAANDVARLRIDSNVAAQHGGKLPSWYKSATGSGAFKVPVGARMGTTADGTRVFSTDGGKTVFNATTGAKIQ